MIRTYTDLLKCDTFLDRFRYLSLRGVVGESTFGFDRYMNQQFYNSTQWRRMRDFIIVRDECNDLAFPGRDVVGAPIIHHMNPMTVDELVNGESQVLDPEFLICVSHRTHNAIHYGDENQLPQDYVPRRPGDTIPWARRS